MQFTARSLPRLDSAALRSLRCSLNSPVVDIAELPVGPASAAIATHEDPRGGCQMTVAIRCRRTGGVVLFGARGESGPEAARIASDSALSFAESMGFLFDDEMCGPDADLEAHSDAIGVWREMVAAAAPPDSAPPPRSGPGPGSDRELVFEDLMHTASPILSKFRWHQQEMNLASAGVDGAPTPAAGE